jgi:hypothetical protein
VYNPCNIESIRRGDGMAIVKEIKKGATTLIFNDDCCKNTTPEEVEASKKLLGEIVYPALRAAYLHKEETG